MSTHERRKDVKSRGEITDTIDRSGTELEEQTGDLGKLEKDIQTVRETLANLDFGGTQEGVNQVQELVSGAETRTTEEFDREDEQLEQVQSENAEFEQELQEHSESEKTDLDKLSEASGRITTDVTVNELLKAKEAALQDVDFLMEQVKRAKEAREKSEQEQQEYQNTVRQQTGKK